MTPMMQQYQKLKAEHADCLLLFRLGDFYELFDTDAHEASKLLNLTLTHRQGVPMCGVPYHALDNYLSRMIRAGKKVAICEQLTDPSLPGIVERDVVRIVTPGTTFDERILDQKSNNFTMGLVMRSQKEIGIAYCDLTTGLFLTAVANNLEHLKDEISRIQPAECIVDQSLTEIPDFLTHYEKLPIFPHRFFDEPQSYLAKHFGVRDLTAFGIEGLEAPIAACALLLNYLITTQKSALRHVHPPKLVARSDEMILDETAIRNLELVRTLRDGGREGSLLSVIDNTQTAAGGRLLRRWLLHPLHDATKIESRLDAVAECIEREEMRVALTQELAKILDLERFIAKLAVGAGNARDLLGIGKSLALIDPVLAALAGGNSSVLKRIAARCEVLRSLLQPLCGEILTGIVDQPGLSIKDGDIIRDGYSQQLDELRTISREGKAIIQRMQQEEITKTGIQSLKIRYNQVFGYYIEVTKANLHLVPERFIRKQTLVNSERFITPELKEYEEKVLGAETKIKELEYQLFCKLREKVQEHTREIQEIAQLLAMIDAILSLAITATIRNYQRPKIVRGDQSLEIYNGRHPVVETIPGMRFVANDTTLDNDKRVVLLTGPNMGGKSTWLRQTALITLLAHVGSFIPADGAQIPLTDRIFTRIGASDSLIHGQSTFMVEMQETAHILHYATSESLIILDEIGRGTSTYDGVSLAWAILEHIHDTVQAKTLFASHYHELVAVADRLAHAVNASVGVKEEHGTIIFLHRIQKGAVSKSYGIEVARLSGIPREITEKAKSILQELEEGLVDAAISDRASAAHVPEAQLSFFGNREHRALEELEAINVDSLTPIDALNRLHSLKKSLTDRTP